MSEDSSTPVTFKQRQPRPVAHAMANGFRNRCPSCGRRGLFAHFLTTETECAGCGTEFHHHRADDLPAYLVVLIVGHVMVGLVMLAQDLTGLGMWQQLALVVPISTAIAVLLLRPVKGAVVGLQWALYMHGFGGDDDRQATEC